MPSPGKNFIWDFSNVMQMLFALLRFTRRC